MDITWESTRSAVITFDDTADVRELDSYYAEVPGYVLGVTHPFDPVALQLDFSRYEWWIAHGDERSDKYIAQSVKLDEPKVFNTAAEAMAACEDYYQRKISRLL